MVDAPGQKRMKGMAKVSFLAHRTAIEADLDAGWPIKAAYQKRASQLGMSYQQFVRYVRSIIRAGEQSAPAVAGTGPGTQPAPAAPHQPLPSPTTEPVHARHDPSRPRTFVYDGNPSPDDDALIFGRSKPKG